MKKIVYLFCFILLSCHVFAHEGEEHKEQKQPGKIAVQKPKSLETTKTISQKVTGEQGTYNLIFLIKPAEPLVGIETEIQVKISKPLSKPDPLLGSEVPVQDATVTGQFVSRSFSSGVVNAHPEENGFFGFHFTFKDPGRYQLQAEAKTSTDILKASLPFVVNPLPGTALVQKGDSILLGVGVFLFFLLLFFQMRRGLTAGEALKASLPGLAAILILGFGAAFILHRWIATRFNAPYEIETRKISISTVKTGMPDAVEIAPDIQKLLGIKTVSVSLYLFNSYLDLPGKITASPQNVHEIHSPVIGQVLPNRIPTVGQHVQKGEVLAVINQTLTAPEQLQVQVQNLELQNKTVEVRSRLAQARTRLSLKEKELERANKLHEIQALALKDLQLAEAEYRSALFEFQETQQQVSLYTNYRVQQKIGTQIRQFNIVSPVSGTVIAMDVTQGELVSPEKRLFTLMDLSTVWVQAQVYEKDLAKVRLGDSANITTAAFPNETFHGALKIFGSVVDPQSRTVQAIFELSNPLGELRDGMLAMVHLKAPSRAITAIPMSALIDEEEKSYVFVRESPASFRRRQVSVGERVGETVEITQGLSAGSQVVTEGRYSLAAQAKKQMKASP